MKLSDIIIDKHLFITIIVLVVLPVILIISDIIFQPIVLFIRDYFKDPFLTAYVIEFLQDLVIYIQYVVFVAMIILYPSYSLIFSKDKYFGKRNSRSAVIEYELVRKIIFILFPFFILAIIFIIAQRYFNQEYHLIDKHVIEEAQGFVYAYSILKSEISKLNLRTSQYD